MSAPTLPDSVRADLAAIAARVDLDARHAAVEAHRWAPSDDPGPVLHLEDVSEIPFVSVIPGVEQYQHRARVRATDGDLFAAVTPLPEGYEAYCRDHLGLGAPEFLQTEPVDGPMAVAKACAHGATFGRLVAVARDAGRMTIHPYMSIDPVWDLARAISDAADVPVQVLGPPPATLWIANDKSLFSDTVRAAVGDGHIVETRIAQDPAAVADALGDVASRHDAVGLKRTRCASAMGNRVFDAADIRALDAAGRRAAVDRFLADTEWQGDEEILVVEWALTDCSPSTQLWLPTPGEGPPLLEGIYEQLLVGREKVFLGSRPSQLPAAVNAELAGISIEVAAALQHLGYVGRCSFDFVVTGDLNGSPGAFRCIFTECNGRWDGTSTPMRLVDRLVDGPRPPYRAQDVEHPDLVGVPFTEIVARLGDTLFDPRTGTGRYILYNCGPLAKKGKFDVIALGETMADAEAAMGETLLRRLGVG